ncbi:MAG: division/cell wall cluster transcriptional repressor MraZ [Gemmataceae bacterium]
MNRVPWWLVGVSLFLLGSVVTSWHWPANKGPTRADETSGTTAFGQAARAGEGLMNEEQAMCPAQLDVSGFTIPDGMPQVIVDEAAGPALGWGEEEASDVVRIDHREAPSDDIDITHPPLGGAAPRTNLCLPVPEQTGETRLGTVTSGSELIRVYRLTPEPIPVPASAECGVTATPHAPAPLPEVQVGPACLAVALPVPLEPCTAPGRSLPNKELPFAGCYCCPIPEQQSVLLPAAVRDQLPQPGPRCLYVAAGTEGCLWLFTPAGLERLGDQLDRAGQGYAPRRLYFAHTEPALLRHDGCLLLPEHLICYAGLHQDAVVIGVGDHWELWNSQRWRLYLEKHSSPSHLLEELDARPLHYHLPVMACDP